MWLYAQSFLAVAALEGIQYVNDMGAGSHHSVMVAMTAQGQAETHVTVDRCVFEGAPMRASVCVCMCVWGGGGGGVGSAACWSARGCA